MTKRTKLKKYSRVLSSILAIFLFCSTPITSYARTAEGNPTTYEEFESDIADHLKLHETAFSIDYEGDLTNFGVHVFDFDSNDSIWAKALNYDDYTSWSFSDCYVKQLIYNDKITVTYTPNYYLTMSQEDYVVEKVDEILNQILTPEMTQTEKLRAIHTWIVNHVTYDDSLTKRDAYLALTTGEVVCQGFAMLLDRMCERAGIQSELVPGQYKDGDYHLWNIVYVDGKWIYDDTTWDTFMVSREFIENEGFTWDESAIDFTVKEIPSLYNDNESLPYSSKQYMLQSYKYISLAENINNIAPLEDASTYASKMVNSTEKTELTSRISLVDNRIRNNYYIKPTTPSNFKAVGAGYNSAKISWNTVSDASGYEILRASSKDGVYSSIKTTTSTSYTNSGLVTGKTYYYKVKAYKDVNNEKIYSNETVADGALPIPSTPTNFKAYKVSSSSIKVSWNAVSGASGYRIYRATSKTGTYTRIKTTSTTSYTNTGLTRGKTYYYKVRAFRYVGNEIIFSKYTSIIPYQL